MILQIAVAIIFFTNKVLVLAGRKSGWLVGALAALIAIFYFYRIGLYVYTALEVGLIILMVYGFMKKDEKKPRVETMIRLVTVLVMLALAIFAFSGVITVVEFASSIGLLMGTYFLTHNKIRLGWIFYALAHSLASILGYSKGQQIFADFQVASAIVSYIAIFKKT